MWRQYLGRAAPNSLTGSPSTWANRANALAGLTAADRFEP
ncbi:hypothetical protein I552_1193 [Mycobacterium xenopi 3993]|nr:hypothetical protein I552_1193 [Mycobacterium xenopi 3993]